MDNLNYDIQIESFKETSILGFIPWKKSAYLVQDGLNGVLAEEFIVRFFKLSKENLFDWIKNHKKSPGLTK